MQLKNPRSGNPWFFDVMVKDQYPEYFDDEETMFEFLTKPYRPGHAFTMLSDRLKSKYNFVKRLVSAKYDEHDDATKYCFHAWRYLSKEEQVKLDELCKKIKKEQEKDD